MNMIGKSVGRMLSTIYNQVHMRSRIRVLKIFLLSTCFSMIIPAVPDDEAGNNGDDYDLARLKNGEILLQTIHTDKPGGAARVTALFHGTPEAVWNVIGYCEYEFVYIRGLKLCEVLKPGQSQMVVHHRLRNSWYTPTLDFTFEASRSPDNIGEARLVSGNLRVLHGLWRLVSLENEKYVIVVHEIRIQPVIPAPRWLVRRSLMNDLPDMIACIRGLARASGGNQRVSDDLKRCAGDVK